MSILNKFDRIEIDSGEKRIDIPTGKTSPAYGLNTAGYPERYIGYEYITVPTYRISGNGDYGLYAKCACYAQLGVEMQKLLSALKDDKQNENDYRLILVVKNQGTIVLSDKVSKSTEYWMEIGLVAIRNYTVYEDYDN